MGVTLAALFRAFRDFLSHTSSHGLKYLAEDGRSLFEICFWLGAVGLGLSAGTFMCVNIHQRSSEAPTVLKLQKTHYSTARMTFPAVTFCNPNPVMASRAHRLLDTLRLPSYMNTSVAVSALLRLAMLQHGPVEASGDYHAGGPELDAILNLNSLQPHQLMPRLSQSCREMLGSCRWRDQAMDCDQIFKQELSHLGYCCSFNYHPHSDELAAHSSELQGERMGLRVALNFQNGRQSIVQDGRPSFAQSVVSNAIAVLIHDPLSFPDEHVIMKMVPANTHVLLPVTMKARTCSDELAEMEPSVRSCLLEREKQLSLFGRYREDNCLTECRVNHSLQLCGCVPYFYPRKSGDRVCDMTDASCAFQHYVTLHSYKPSSGDEVEIEEHSGYTRRAQHNSGALAMQCNCPPQCSQLMLSARVSWSQLHREIETETETGKAIVDVYIASELSQVITKESATSASSVLGLLGGIASLFLGCSFVTPVELCYFLTVRLLTFLGRPREGGLSCPNSPRAIYHTTSPQIE